MNGLSFKEFGEPTKVLTYGTLAKPVIKSDQLLVKVFAAPINPSDALQVSGVYPMRPHKVDSSYFPGNEGSGEIVEVGNDVSDFKVGDLVIIAAAAVGTWREFTVVNKSQVIKVHKELNLKSAAIFSVNPTTAFRMLRDFGEHKVIIQSAANSNVGTMVIQMAKLLNIKTINIIRDRPDVQLLKNRLTDLGADFVFTDKELATKEVAAEISALKPTLAFDAVSGEIAANIANTLERHSIFVSYGSMSLTPIPISATLLIFKNITFRGFWLATWYMEHSLEDKIEMFREIEEMTIQGKITFPKLREFHISDYKSAFGKGDKALFVMSKL